MIRVMCRIMEALPCPTQLCCIAQEWFKAMPLPLPCTDNTLHTNGHNIGQRSDGPIDPYIDGAQLGTILLTIT
jgi:hypothetical protein